MWRRVLTVRTLDSEGGSALSSPNPCTAGIYTVPGTELVVTGMGVDRTGLGWEGWEQTDICSWCKKRWGTNIRRYSGGIIPWGKWTRAHWLQATGLSFAEGHFYHQPNTLSSLARVTVTLLFSIGFLFPCFYPRLRIYNRHPECSSSTSALTSLWILWKI